MSSLEWDDWVAACANAEKTGSNQEKRCRRCRVSLCLTASHEWPETDHLLYCQTCSIDVVRELRSENKRLKTRLRNLR